MRIDMSPHAVTERLKKTSELRRLCIALGGERLRERLRRDRIREPMASAGQVAAAGQATGDSTERRVDKDSV